MKKSVLIAACGLGFAAASALAQVGSLGSNGAVSNTSGGLGSGIRSGARGNGIDPNTGIQVVPSISTPAAAAGASTSTITANTTSASPSTPAPILSGSSWGSPAPSANSVRRP